MSKALLVAAEAGPDGLTDELAAEFQRWQLGTPEDGWCKKVWTYGLAGRGPPDGAWARDPGRHPRPDHGHLCLEVSHDMLAGSTGCHEWEAGFWLAEYILGHPEEFRGGF